MRTFWIILGVLVLLAGGLWFMRGSATSPAPDLSQTASPAVAPAAPAPATPHEPVSPPSAVPAAAQPAAVTPVPAPAPSDSKPAVTATTPAPSEPTPATQSATATEEKPKPAADSASSSGASSATLTAISQDLANLIGGDDMAIKPVTPHPSLDEQPAASVPTSAASTTQTPAATPAAPRATSSAPPADPNAPAKLVPQDDGTTLVDDRFIIKGDGSKANPYRVTWEMLVSAQDTFQPRLGRKIIPGRVKMLDGKWVKISGYIAFPLMAQSNDEMLIMLNQWDGCCIGVPPTPFDAVEVKLKKAAVGDERMRVSGTLIGILRVDPYLVKDWLVSLYLMDDGELSDLAGEAAPKGEHAK